MHSGHQVYYWRLKILSWTKETCSSYIASYNIICKNWLATINPLWSCSLWSVHKISEPWTTCIVKFHKRDRQWGRYVTCININIGNSSHNSWKIGIRGSSPNLTCNIKKWTNSYVVDRPGENPACWQSHWTVKGYSISRANCFIRWHQDSCCYRINIILYSWLWCRAYPSHRSDLTHQMPTVLLQLWAILNSLY